MQPPIFVDEHGDLEAFESIAHAEQGVESIDVMNDEYVAYDVNGLALGFRCGPGGHVTIFELSPAIDRSDALRSTLTNILTRVGHERGELGTQGLGELTALFLSKYGFSR